MSKIIIGIHGLGNKPPHDTLHKWWLKSICEGLQKINKLDYTPDFELVYWADILNDKPLNSLIADSENPYFLDEPYSLSPEHFILKPNSTRKKFLGFLEHQMDKIFLNDDLTPNFTFISEMIFKKYFRELDVYYSKGPEVNDKSYKTVKDIIRNRLAEIIKKHKVKEIFLIAHSMGSIIAYDVLSFLIPEIKIHTLATMGSPLGMPIIVSKIAEESKTINPKFDKLQTPKNVTKAWYNFSDIEDNVAINYTLSDDYEKNDIGIKVKDIVVVNDYMIKEERNPHKSYGYLRSKEFSEILSQFLLSDISKFELWRLKVRDKINSYMKKIMDKS
ncbi:MAG: hypothetical protein KDC88_12445 [Ignavibacteriae bacterium]|nr:hypothetical protein [Ignavibacteriota bacterium]MCB9208407.1 hypothetical protein [Ignavibacteriales bacterium]MCB9259169.1 hypothetical protein [Ignavibacteriales bacterium]